MLLHRELFGLFDELKTHKSLFDELKTHKNFLIMFDPY